MDAVFLSFVSALLNPHNFHRNIHYLCIIRPIPKKQTISTTNIPTNIISFEDV